MERYYESETLIEFIKQNTPHINGETTIACVERAIREAPTADVAPRAEVEKWHNALMGECMICCCPLKNEIRAEVARGIFAEIDVILKSSAPPYIKEALLDALKKKYTGE